MRPLALSPGRTQLFAVNTPDNRFERFDLEGGGELLGAGVVQVGMEPVAVAVRTNHEVPFTSKILGGEGTSAGASRKRARTRRWRARTAMAGMTASGLHPRE